MCVGGGGGGGEQGCRKLIVEHFRFKEMISFLVFCSRAFTNIPV